jgi:cytochrome c oxidase subunit 2
MGRCPRGRGVSRILARRLAGPLLLGLTACRAPIESLSPATARGAAIADLFGLALALSAAIVLLVVGLLAYVLVRYRARPGAPDPPQTHGNTRLEIAWTAAPTALLTGMFLLMLQTMNAVEADVPPDALTVRVIGRQWWWEVAYPEHGIVTANELHLPVGRPLRLRIEAADVIHSFWVPRLGWKRDAVPGNRPNDIHAEFAEAGVFDGWCTEYCGAQHAWMRPRVFVEPPEQFEAWVSQQRQPPAPPLSPGARRGEGLFARSTCVNCHTVQGTAAAARVGPDLSHFGGRTTIGAGVVENTPENLRLWLRTVQSVKPGALMPNYTALSEEEIAALADYLMELR